jgi:DNA ligase (NAD+)
MYKFIDYWDIHRHNLPFATDGIVFKVDNIQQQDILGFTAKSPRWAIAYKFQAERAYTRLNDVIFQLGRTGTVTPVAVMNPVQLSGTIVQRASLHNADIIRNLDLHIGDFVYIEKAGEIIPQIISVDTSSRNADLGKKVEFPQFCPECGAQLVRYTGEAAHYCPNDTGCIPQIKGRIEHFVSRDAMNIDSVGPETIEMLFNQGLLPHHDAADLYALHLSDLCSPHSTREKSCRKIIDGIHASIQMPFDRVLYALGIRFVGKVVAKQVARHFRTMSRLSTATYDELLSIDGVGKIIAESIITYFAKPENQDFISRLTIAGLQMALPDEDKISDIFLGKRIVISGSFEKYSREEYKLLIEKHGGKNVSSISKKTSFILAGASMGPSKQEKAKSLGIPIISETAFLKMLEE